jgi:hypothetical protein
MMKLFSARNGVIALALAAGLLAGCKSQRTDQQIAADIQTKIQGESALSQQNIQVGVANGVATLSGSVSDDASRALAGNDSGTIAGVKSVVNNLTVQTPQQATAASTPVATQPAQTTPAPAKPSSAQPERNRSRFEQKRSASQPVPQPVQQVAQTAPPAPIKSVAPAAPPQPVVKQVALPAGTALPIRITEALDTKTAQSNDAFHGSVASDIEVQGVVAIPHGSPVMGRIVEARQAAHFKGSALLTLELTAVTAHGNKITLVTDPFTKEGAGRGKNTAAKTGGGAVLGSIIGGLAGGGKGAVIGGLAGAGAGTGVNAATRGQEIEIPSETLINFRLQSPVSLSITVSPSGAEGNSTSDSPQLHTR